MNLRRGKSSLTDIGYRFILYVVCSEKVHWSSGSETKILELVNYIWIL